MTWQGRNCVWERPPVAVRVDGAFDGVHDVFWSTWRIDLRSMTVGSGRILD
jgi:hypothetical protein